MKNGNIKTKKATLIKEAEIYLNKIEPEKHFTIIYESVYLNNSLNGYERAILYTLITASPNFKPSHKNLKSILKFSQRSIKEAIKGLKEKGYLYIERNGQNGYIWTITQKPIKAQAQEFTREPKKTLELLQKGTINEQQAIKDICRYIADLKDDNGLTLTEFKNVIQIIKTKWIDNAE